MTGRSSTEDAIAALRSNVIDFVSKPFVIRELAESVQRAMDRVRQRRERSANANAVAEKMAAAADERSRLMATLNQTAADLEVSKRTRNDLIAMVSHELRTPLIPIIGFAESLRRSPTTSPKDIRDWASTIEQNGKRLLSMINGALDIVSLDQGRQPPARNGVVLEILLGRVVAAQRALALERSVRVVLRAQPGLIIDADARAIELAIGHLVDNAVRASPTGETVRVVVRTAGAFASIAVSDRGPGVPPSVTEQLGTPFLQADLSYCRRWQGVGLGLALALRIIRSHGGRLSLVPRSDGGTVALVELPLSAESTCRDTSAGMAGANDVADEGEREPSYSTVSDSDVLQKSWWSH
jgi:two-component system cell cycle sensor histidine kinase PleC